MTVVELAFDPSQPRDDIGRWTDTGGTGLTLASRELRPGTGVYQDQYGVLDIRSTGVDRIRQAVYEYVGGQDVFDVVLIEDADGVVTGADVENLYGADGTVEGEAALEAWLGNAGIDDVTWDGDRAVLHASHRAAIVADDGSPRQQLVSRVEDAYSGTIQNEYGATFTIGDVNVVSREGMTPISTEVSGSIYSADGTEVGMFRRSVYADGTVYNHSLNINSDRQGEGIGTAFLDKTESALGAATLKLSAVGVGKYAWAARGYRLDSSPGNRTIASFARDAWIFEARKALSDTPEWRAGDYSKLDALAAVETAWSRDLDSIYPADLIAIDPSLKSVLLDGPSWSGILERDPALVAGATGPNKRSSSKDIVGSHGHHAHGPSILWPALYEHLRRKGYSKSKAAAISNARWNKKHGAASATTESLGYDPSQPRAPAGQGNGGQWVPANSTGHSIIQEAKRAPVDRGDNPSVWFADDATVAEARALADEKARTVPKPTRAQIAKNHAALMKARTQGRPGGELRGNSYTRRARAEALFAEFGGAELGWCPCVHCGIKLSPRGEGGFARLQQDKILTLAEGGSYGTPRSFPNLIPACGGCNNSRGDTPYPVRPSWWDELPLAAAAGKTFLQSFGVAQVLVADLAEGKPVGWDDPTLDADAIVSGPYYSRQANTWFGTYDQHLIGGETCEWRSIVVLRRRSADAVDMELAVDESLRVIRLNQLCALHELAGCTDAACAPPPVGTGGSHPSGGGSSAPGSPESDPRIRSDGVPFEFDSVTALADQYRDDADEAARFKAEGAALVALFMGEEEKQEIADELNAISVGDLEGQIGAIMLNEVENQVNDFGLDLDRMPLGVAMQAATLAKAWRRDYPKYEVTERFQAAVEAFNAGGSAADLSAAIDGLGVSVAQGAVDWRNSQWQSSSVTPAMVAFHLQAASQYRLGEASRALYGYYPSGSYEVAREIQRMIPTTLQSILSSDRYAVEDTIQMTVRRDNRATITLYRGVKDTGHQATNLDNVTTIQPNPLSSWSADRSIAESFAGQHSTNGGWLIEAEIPVEQIIAMATINGWGSLREREVIVMGNPVEASSITPINRDRVQA